MASKKQVAESLATVPLFARCTKRDLKTIARHVELIEIEEGVAVVTEGEDGESFFLILQGSAEVHQGDQKTADLGVNDYFGELSLLDPAPRSATVTTTSAVTVAVLSVRMFRVLLRDMPQIAGGLLSSLAAGLREARRN